MQGFILGFITGAVVFIPTAWYLARKFGTKGDKIVDAAKDQGQAV